MPDDTHRPNPEGKPDLKRLRHRLRLALLWAAIGLLILLVHSGYLAVRCIKSCSGFSRTLLLTYAVAALVGAWWVWRAWRRGNKGPQDIANPD